MDDLDVLARNFGFRPQGKSAPMRSDVGDSRASSIRSSSSPFIDDHDGLVFNDVFGGPPKYANTSNSNKSPKASSMSDFDYDSIFISGNDSRSTHSSKPSSGPVYDKPVYDEDIFDGLPGLKSKSVSSSSVRFDDNVFASMSSPPKQNQNSGHFDDLLGNLGRSEKVVEPKSSKSSGSKGFDDLLAGFGSDTRPFSGPSKPPKPTANSNQTSNVMDDPFVVLESTSGSSPSGAFSDPLEEISNLGKSGSAKADASSVGGGVFDDLDPLNGFGKPVPPFSSERSNRGKDLSPSRSEQSTGRSQASTNQEHNKTSFRYSESPSLKKVHSDNYQESPIFDMPNISTDSQKSFGKATSPPPYASADLNDSTHVDSSPNSEEEGQPSEDIWLTVSDIPLFTQPTRAPPPSRPPPPVPRRISKSEHGSFSSSAKKKNDNIFSPPSYGQYSTPVRPSPKSAPVSQLDELEDFAMGRARISVDESAQVHSDEEMNANSAAAASAAAMKEAMDRAEAKFRHAKEVREREYAKAARSKESVQPEKDEYSMQDDQERELRENQERLERERRQREEEEREQRRLEKERERAREIERERERQAVERATREARERAAVEARERAAAEARMRSERAAVEKANAEARERAERAAVLRAQAEARERAAAEAKERAEKAAAEARERESKERAAAAAKAEADARRRAERAAVERAAAEARERAAAEARERAAAAAAARMNQQKNENDLESFFSMGSRANSAPRPRATSSDSMFDPPFQSKGGPEGAKTTSYNSASSNMRKASSTTNIVDDLSSIFGAPSSGEFQDIDGESEERRKARLERHQRTQERAARALAEKNQRDLQVQKEQEERHRIAETLDIEIKRWSAGKEGNLRALLSTLQYVLWPECGWQPVSLTDLIAGASVKKIYRKATLCIHPDKVQQKGATLQQKYIAEKVFDLLKEAWNKFNSEELF